MKKILFVLLYIFETLFGVLCVYKVSTNDDSIVVNGKILESVSNNKITTTYNGTWELYYNKFIVTDNLDLNNIKPDCYIDLPQSWHKQKSQNTNSSLPLSGYASYRVVVDNLKENDVIKFFNEPQNVSMNVYINKTLIASIGFIGKTKEENKYESTFSSLDSYTIEHDLNNEIIIEVGYNDYGGLTRAPSFTQTIYKDSTKEILKYFTYALVVIFFILFIVELVSVFVIYDSTIYTVNETLCLVLFIITTPCFNEIISGYGAFLKPIVLSSLHFLIYSLYLYFSSQFLDYTYLKKMQMKDHIIYLSIILINCILYTLLIRYNLHYIVFFAYTIFFLLRLLFLTYMSKKTNKFDFTFYIVKSILYLVIGLETLIIFSKFYFSHNVANAIVITYLLAIFFNYIFIYIAFIIRTYVSASKAMELEVANTNMKLLLLKDQIKPHFIFNSLNAIKNLYHKDINEGDYALQLFSNHLRFNVNTVKTNLIDFSKEIENVYNFVELENLKIKNKFNVIFNIDYEDFLIPILSIEPFVENAIKYSKTNEKENGYIEISSTIDSDNYIKIIIKDNGIGFDTTKINSDSSGIENACERLKKLVNADIKIMSKVGLGTLIKIIIRKDDSSEDNNS